MAGRRRTTERDWLFGGPGRRALLACLLEPEASGRPWTQTELAEASGLSKKGSVDVHLAGLLQVGFIEREGDIYSVNDSSPLVSPILTLIRVTDGLSERAIEFEPRRRGST